MQISILLRRVLPAALVAILVATLAACGGSGTRVVGERLVPAERLDAPRLLEVGISGAKSASGPPIGIQVTWTRNSEPGVQGYYLYRDTQSIPDPPPDQTLPPQLRTNSGLLIEQPPGGPTVTFNDIFDVVVGETYYYRVTVVDEFGDESYPSNEVTWLAHGQTISGLNPTAVYWGQAITLTGDTFGVYNPVTDKVLFSRLTGGWIEGGVVDWTDTLIEVIVPNDVRTSPVLVSIAGTLASTDEPLVILNPYIINITPEVGFVEESLLVIGENFGDGSSGTVLVGTQDVTSAVTSWTEQQIELDVPVGLVAGNVVVEVQGRSSNGIQFRPRAQVLDAPSAAVTGTQIELSGRYFGSLQGTLWLGGVQLPILEWSDDQILAQVIGPQGNWNLVVQSLQNGESNVIALSVESQFGVSISVANPSSLYTPDLLPLLVVTPSSDPGDVSYGLYAETDSGPLLIGRSSPLGAGPLPVHIQVHAPFVPNGAREVYLEVTRLGYTVRSNTLVLSFHSLPGDFNGDGLVNLADRDFLETVMGLKFGDEGFRPWYDGDGDGAVTELDLALVGYNFGQSNPVPSFPGS